MIFHAPGTRDAPEELAALFLKVCGFLYLFGTSFWNKFGCFVVSGFGLDFDGIFVELVL